MRLLLLMVGKFANPHYAALAEDYLHRIGRYAPQVLETVRGEKIDRLSEAEVLAREAGRLAARLDPKDYCVILDRTGQSLSSEQLAQRVQAWQMAAHKQVVFVIGGPLGLGEELVRRADERLSLSAMTFAHELSAVVLLEQLYRAFSILRGEKYHK